MDVLVLNCGSSSLKYQLIDMSSESVLAKGLCERIGIEGSNMKHSPAGKDDYKVETPMPTHKDAVKLVLEALVDPGHGVIANISDISACGHRVVHGGENFAQSVLISADVMKALEECSQLAPLHNPANIIGIEACQASLPNVPQVAVFDTSFHQTMPEKAFLYALPYEYYENHKIRKYGFHGTSHRYVSQEAAKLLGKPYDSLKLISCHLGNGASVCAIDGGKSVDTSMGLTPLEGLAMGTRCGDLDPAVLTFVMEKEGLTAQQVVDVFNKKSGVLGVSGVSSDFRDVEGAAAQGNARAKAALDLYYYRVAKYVGEYAAAMNGVDAVIFTAGLGENSKEARAAICGYLGYLGISVDTAKNDVRGKTADFATADSKVRALTIPTNEELVIARDTKELLDK
ncbi:MAG: acetate kinase [Defluviitaleaceae bacterium]|nr:acetate kinase [Defluviitaleaceae bacterium]